MRRHIATDAARIMAEEGVRDFHAAKRKAAARLGLPETKHLPGNDEVDAALQEYLRLFHAGRLNQSVRRLRELAAEAMHFLSKFDPRLVGPVLSGIVTSATEIEIHLTAESPEEIGFWLQEHSIPYEQTDRRLRFGGDRQETFPAYRFTADNVPIELCIFDRRESREPPLSPVDGKPMKRANLREVENLMSEAAEP
ncbi:MAG: hypothetical protein HY082_10335 [Gammaproteobacteria bacterium]|nr:hypothetical protein [Gammaproteobacteria bacterium]